MSKSAQPTPSPELKRWLAKVFQLPEDEITSDLSMAWSGSWDSLSHMELVMSLEESLGMSLQFNEILEMRDVSGIQSVLQTRQITPEQLDTILEWWS